MIEVTVAVTMTLIKRLLSHSRERTVGAAAKGGEGGAFNGLFS